MAKAKEDKAKIVTEGGKTRVYFIPNWRENFETHMTEKLKLPPRFVGIPTKMSGESMNNLKKFHKRGLFAFGLYTILVKYSMGRPSPRFGFLTTTGGPEGRPLDLDDLVLMWPVSKRCIQDALDILTSERVGWLTLAERSPDGCRTVAERLPDVCSTPSRAQRSRSSSEGVKEEVVPETSRGSEDWAKVDGLLHRSFAAAPEPGEVSAVLGMLEQDARAWPSQQAQLNHLEAVCIALRGSYERGTVKGLLAALKDRYGKGGPR